MSEISSVRSFVKTFVFKVFASTIMKLPVGKGKHIIFYFIIKIQLCFLF